MDSLSLKYADICIFHLSTVNRLKWRFLNLLQPDEQQPDGMQPELSGGLRSSALLQNTFVMLILFFPKLAIKLAMGPSSSAQSQPSPDLS